MSDITVTPTSQEPAYLFQVVVKDNNTQTSHSVSMTHQFYQNLVTRRSPSEVVRASFEFLLEREPKESILLEFDVTVISQYFPEYEKELKKRLKDN
ncbi:hypothetical protein KO465_10390 [Candidatus Micrarchaeota archaeon]|jgi:hypothetical protein|nr:hypothetical protein [Candidatus Micrarchaeota archaeon]